MTPEEDKKITRAEVEKKLEELKAEIAELKAWHDEKPKPPHPSGDRYLMNIIILSVTMKYANLFGMKTDMIMHFIP